MKWIEMDGHQRAERISIVEALTATGWKETTFSSWFLERSLVLDREAELDYHNKTVSLRVGYIAAEHAIYLSIRQGLFLGSAIGLIIFFENKLIELLKEIQAFQDQISPENYKDHIQSLLNLCPSIFADGHEYGRIPLLP